MTRLALLLALALALTACGDGGGGFGRAEVLLGTVRIDAEVARSVEQRAQGLAGRDSIPREAGMLFLQGEERQAGFTMRGMRFALDFVWMDADRRVVELTENVPPPAPGDEDPGLFGPEPLVLYVLEVNAGVVAESGVMVGDVIEFELAGEGSS